MYRFDWASTAYGGMLKACHALEIPFVVHNLDDPWAQRFLGEGPSGEALADQMHAAWIAFVRTGRPTAPTLPTWPPMSHSPGPRWCFPIIPPCRTTPVARYGSCGSKPGRHSADPGRNAIGTTPVGASRRPTLPGTGTPVSRRGADARAATAGFWDAARGRLGRLRWHA
jgi:hypothetical protein